MPLGSDPKKTGSGLGFASKIGTGLVASILIGAYGGYLLDDYLNSTPWLMLLGMLFGGASGFLSVYRGFQELESENDTEDQSANTEN